MKFNLLVLIYTLHLFSIAINLSAAAADTRYSAEENCTVILYSLFKLNSTEIETKRGDCNNLDDIDFHVLSLDFEGCIFADEVCVRWHSDALCKLHGVEQNTCYEGDTQETLSDYLGDSIIRSIMLW